jgi:hypothetical protein
LVAGGGVGTSASSIKMARDSGAFTTDTVDPPKAETTEDVASSIFVAAVAAFPFFVEDFLGGITVMTGAMFRPLSMFTSDNGHLKRLLLILTRKIEKTRRVFEID